MGRIKVVASQSNAAWKPLPKGTYDFAITSVEEKTTKNDNPQIVLKLEVIDGPHAGKKATHFVVVNEKTGGFVKELVEATAIDAEVTQLDEINAEDGKPFIEVDFDADDLAGANFRADASVYEHEGQERNRLTRLRPVGTEVSTSGGAKVAAPAVTRSPAGRPAAAPAAGHPPVGARPRRSRI